VEWGLPGNRPAPRESRRHSARWPRLLPTPRESSVELATGVHLPVEGWTDARIGQSLKINISLTIAKT